MTPLLTPLCRLCLIAGWVMVDETLLGSDGEFGDVPALGVTVSGGSGGLVVDALHDEA